MYKVIFDTNTIEPNVNQDFDKCIGRQTLIKEFIDLDCKIIIPDMVIGEIKNHKQKYIKKQLDNLKNNKALQFLNYDLINELQDFNIDKHIDKLLEKEQANFNITIIKLSNTQVLYEMKDRVLSNSTPFEETGDKGFKDTYIYYTILEYLDNINDNKVFFMTRDEKLISAFEGHHRIKTIKNIDEFKNMILEKYNIEYLINEIKEYLKTSEEPILKTLDVNLLNQDVLTLEIAEKKYSLILDNNEIVSYTDKDYKECIQQLINSRCFSATHTHILNITTNNLVNYFTKYDRNNILSAYETNDQISWIIEDEDVKSLRTSLLFPRPPTNIALNDIKTNKKDDFI